MKVVFKIIKGILTFFLVIVLLLVLFQKITKNKLAIGNIFIFQVASESMKPEYDIGDIIVVKKTPGDELKVGDNVTYLGKESNLKGLIITHKIIETRVEDEKHYYVTKGTANEIEDPEINEDDIYGKVVYHSFLFSFVGRIMTNIVAYYLLFVLVGVAFAYEVISSIFFKKDKEDNEKSAEGN